MCKILNHFGKLANFHQNWKYAIEILFLMVSMNERVIFTTSYHWNHDKHYFNCLSPILVRICQNGQNCSRFYTFHHYNSPPFNFLRMCNPFIIEIYAYTDQWKRMISAGYEFGTAKPQLVYIIYCSKYCFFCSYSVVKCIPMSMVAYGHRNMSEWSAVLSSCYHISHNQTKTI